MYLAQDAIARKDYQAAMKGYESLLAKQPENPVLLNNYAWAAGKAGDPRALDYAEKANRLAPNQAAIIDATWMCVAPVNLKTDTRRKR